MPPKRYAAVKRRYRRRRYGKSKLVKLISKVAKVAVSKREELKRALQLSWNGDLIKQSVTGLTTYLLTGITGGDAVSNREGNQCRLRSLYFKGRIEGTGAPPSFATANVRIIVFWDKQPVIGTPATCGNVLDMGTNPVFYGQVNWGNRRRFKIIHDKIYTLASAPTNIANWKGERDIKIYKQFKLPKLSYQDATATNVMGPHLYVGIFSSESDNTFVVSGHWVVKFKEF